MEQTTQASDLTLVERAAVALKSDSHREAQEKAVLDALALAEAQAAAKIKAEADAVTAAEAQAVIDSREFSNDLVKTWVATGDALVTKPESRELKLMREIAHVMGLEVLDAIADLQKFPYQSVLSELSLLEIGL